MELKVWADISFSPTKLTLLEVKYLRGQMYTPDDLIEEEIVDFSTDYSMSIGFNLAEDLLKANFIASLSSKYADDKETGATAAYELSYIYSYQNLKEMVQEGEDGIVTKIHPGLFNAISSISYSTSRGLLISRLQGTSFSDFVLPIIDPNLLKHNV